MDPMMMQAYYQQQQYMQQYGMMMPAIDPNTGQPYPMYGTFPGGAPGKQYYFGRSKME
jgi:hypothetical protein